MATGKMHASGVTAEGGESILTKADILAYSTAIRGVCHPYHRTACSINRQIFEKWRCKVYE